MLSRPHASRATREKTLCRAPPARTRRRRRFESPPSGWRSKLSRGPSGRPRPPPDLAAPRRQRPITRAARTVRRRRFQSPASRLGARTSIRAMAGGHRRSWRPDRGRPSRARVKCSGFVVGRGPLRGFSAVVLASVQQAGARGQSQHDFATRAIERAVRRGCIAAGKWPARHSPRLAPRTASLAVSHWTAGMGFWPHCEPLF